MATEMPKNYQFKETETRLYKWWEENGWFKPEVNPDGEPYVISIPPPNVTGALHMGHAMFVSLEDLMIRRARMQGRAALWVPGTDHAGIATQLVIEKELRKLGKSREEIGRDAFLDFAWEWKDRYEGRIINQMRTLGGSADWSRTRFTLDEGLSEAVYTAFERLHRMGLIYREERMVNWSPGLQTAVSDLEVETEDEPALLYYFKYPLKEGGHLPVATTRPETILGDSAVAVNPDDERYKQYIGKTALVPMLNREIPVIADEYVDMAFGTGALKVTPAHDHNDFELGKKHGLPFINIMNKDATINEGGGAYAGLSREDARDKLWADMESAELTLKTTPHTRPTPRSQRGGEIVEPMVSIQWWANMQPGAELALAAVRSGRIEIVPKRFNKIWEHWLTGILPWCISRQLWWGHRIPVYYVNDDESQYVVARSETEAYQKARAKYGDDVTLRQDPDVLDTWFSSALWPFSTLGWPDKTPDLDRYYPTTMMETGYDILFFWVARMAMQGLLLTNDIPFETVYLHGLVRDEKGRKMSKTIGNVVDPVEVTAEYGTDALRFTLLTGGTPGNDLNLAIDKVESNRNFATKIWNTARFIVANLGKGAQGAGEADYTSADKWILTRMSETITDVDRLMDGYNYGEAGRQAYDFLKGEFADWYIEASKAQLNEGGARANATLTVLLTVLDTGLRLLHPFIPYVTEETWQQLKHAFQSSQLEIAPDGDWPEALIIANWPTAGDIFADEAANFDRLRELIRGIRASRAEYNVPPSKRIAATIVAGENAAFIESQRNVLVSLARLDDGQLEIVANADAADNAATVSLGDYTAYLPLAGMVDLAKERARLEKESVDLQKQITRLTKLLGSPFAKKAPAAIVQKERDKLALLQSSFTEVTERLQAM